MPLINSSRRVDRYSDFVNAGDQMKAIPQSFFLVCAAWLVIGGGASAGDAEPDTVLAQLDIPNDGDALVTSVSVNGEKHLFVIDTGATRVTYDRRFRSLLGPVKNTIVTVTQDGESKRELFDAPAAELAGLRLGPTAGTSSELVGCTDLVALRDGCGHEIYGIIGMSFLKAYVIQLDFDQRKLLFLTKPGQSAGERVPLVFDKGMPHLYARLPRYGASLFLLDTGQFGTNGSIRTEVAEELLGLGQTKRVPPTEWRFLFTGSWERRPLILSSVKIGAFEHQQLQFDEHAGGLPNLLGLGYMARYIVTIDFPNQAIYFKPSKRFARPDGGILDGCERLGLGLMREGAEIVVTMVQSRKPAELAGLHVWDVVLTVNGHDVSDARLIQVYSLLNEAKGDVTFTVRRGSRTIELKAPTGETMNDLDNTAHSTEQSRATRSKREGATAGKKEPSAIIQKDRSN